MSQRDQELIDSLGIPVARLAQAIDKSRQTVNRGIKNPARDYFKPAILIKALENWRDNDPSLFALAKSAICDRYPGARDAVLRALEDGTSDEPFTADVWGEYWLISGDLCGFQKSVPLCLQQLRALSHLEDTQIKLFVPATRDQIRAATRLIPGAPTGAVQVFACDSLDMRLVPTILLRIDDADDLHLYGVSPAGFTPLSRHEAARLRTVIKIVAPESEEPDRVALGEVQ